MFSLSKKNKRPSIPSEAVVIDWAKTEEDKYYNLLALKPKELNLDGFGGVYIVWYIGLTTTVIYTGITDDFVATFELVRENTEILAFHEKGNLGITWAPIQEKYRNRIASYLRLIMPPLLVSVPEIDNNFTEETPFPVVPPFYL